MCKLNNGFVERWTGIQVVDFTNLLLIHVQYWFIKHYSCGIVFVKTFKLFSTFYQNITIFLRCNCYLHYLFTQMVFFMLGLIIKKEGLTFSIKSILLWFYNSVSSFISFISMWNIAPFSGCQLKHNCPDQIKAMMCIGTHTCLVSSCHFPHQNSGIYTAE